MCGFNMSGRLAVMPERVDALYGWTFERCAIGRLSSRATPDHVSSRARRSWSTAV